MLVNKLVVSIGAFGAWNQTLKSSYKVHGEISKENADDIKSIYEYKLDGRFYVSIQLKL